MNLQVWFEEKHDAAKCTPYMLTELWLSEKTIMDFTIDTESDLRASARDAKLWRLKRHHQY